MPDRIHFTGSDEADELLAREPLALLIGFALDQQVPVQTALLRRIKNEDHEVKLAAARALAGVVVEGSVREVLLEDSYHVATMDNDLPLIVEQTLAFVRERAPMPSAG